MRWLFIVADPQSEGLHGNGVAFLKFRRGVTRRPYETFEGAEQIAFTSSIGSVKCRGTKQPQIAFLYGICFFMFLPGQWRGDHRKCLFLVKRPKVPNCKFNY